MEAYGGAGLSRFAVANATAWPSAYGATQEILWRQRAVFALGSQAMLTTGA